MSAQQQPDAPVAPVPGRSLADAAKELRALMRMQRARERAGREARHLERLTAQAARRRAAAEQPDDKPGGDR